eukprot:1291862-Ditylum_brightwellii.AAC.1
MERALYVFGYLKKTPNQWIRIDSRDPMIVNNRAEGNFSVDLSTKLKDYYPDAKEAINDRVLKPFFDELSIMAYMDSNHALDKVAIETSTYGAEFMAMKTAVEE